MSTLLLEKLNQAQIEAVMHRDGPCSVMAGAGSGKTRVLVHRLAYLIEVQKVDPFSILALTFTNKAAKEMQNRVFSLLGEQVYSLWIGTFHALFTRLLRKEATVLGYDARFTIYDKADSLALAKSILKEANIPEEKCKPQALLEHISSAKRELIPWRLFLQTERTDKTLIGPLYQKYVERCYKANAMDFDDLLFNTYLLFDRHPEILKRYQAAFRYIMIDEFQDTNRVQYLVAQQLAAPENNLCVVGDDSQSIYSFRGANIENILHFKKVYPKAVIMRLEQNYRSTVNIIGAANSLISKNRQQIEKKNWTANPAGALVEVVQAQDDNEEGRLVAAAVFAQQHNFSCPGRDIAILYRMHSQSRAIEEALRRLQIPYRVYGGTSFYARKEIKDVLAYLHFVLNPSDEVFLKRIINLPRRGIGSVYLERLHQVATDHSLSLWEALQAVETLLPGRTGKVFQPFVNMITSCMSFASKEPKAYALAHHIVERSGLLKAYYEDRTVEGMSRYENVQELFSAIRAFETENKEPHSSLEAFLQEVTLMTDADRDASDTDNNVQLMTVHMAKGLEFKAVFVVGLEEKIFPSAYAKDANALEEERRLLYVAMTRAKERLFFSYAGMRYQYGSLSSSEPSRFLFEMDEHFFSKDVRAPGSFVPLYRKRALSANKVSKFKKIGTFSPPPPEKSEVQDIQVGMKVEHRLFGIGQVLEISRNSTPQAARARISFANGEKTLVLAYARLKIAQ